MTSRIAAANAVVQKAIDQVIGAGREIGLQVAAYKDGQLVVDTWGGVGRSRLPAARWMATRCSTSIR